MALVFPVVARARWLSLSARPRPSLSQKPAGHRRPQAPPWLGVAAGHLVCPRRNRCPRFRRRRLSPRLQGLLRLSSDVLLTPRVAPCIRGGTPSDYRFPVHDVGLSPRKQGADASGVIILSPVLARPGARPKSRCRSTSWGSPRCRARVAGRISTALLTRRRSSKAMRMRSGW